MSAPELVGWELLYTIIEPSIKCEADVIIAITHWLLVKEYGFRCLGNGDHV